MAWIESHWERVTPVSLLLYPLSLLYGAAAAARRATATPVRLPVPVVVVGNITAGGTGKTPLTLWLAEFLRAHGRSPGIVSRGYGGDASGPARVEAGSDPRHYGDEAVLLARESGCPVWIAADRVAAAQALLAAEPACDVILSDDGLQHYHLARDVEICVVDGSRGFGNGWLLPAGPLREMPSRLASVDAVVINGAAPIAIPGNAPRFAMTIDGREFRNLLNPSRTVGAEAFQGQRVHVVAGIGNPDRFFRHLETLGLDFTAHPFPDHHPYAAADIAFDSADAVLMTGKDAVKCRSFASERHWELAVNAVPVPAFGEFLLGKIRK